MKHVLLAAFLCSMLLQVSARADGYPFDPDTQRLTVPSLRLKLNEAQVKEVSASGTLTFSDEQMRLLRLYYPAATQRTDVVAATFNDNIEGLTEESAGCFWVAPDEVAVRLNEKHPKDSSPFGDVVNTIFPSDAELKTDPHRHLRLSPTGSIYFRGELISLERAFGLIDDLARFSKTAPGNIVSPDGGSLSVTMPPPLSPQQAGYVDERQPLPKQILEALTTYAGARSVHIQQSW